MPRTLGPNCRMHILCDACRAVFQKVTLIRDPAATLLPSTSHHRLHESLKSFEETVEQGCHFCSLILYSLSRFGMLPQTEPEYVSTPVYLTFRYTQGDGDKRVTWLDEKISHHHFSKSRRYFWPYIAVLKFGTRSNQDKDLPTISNSHPPLRQVCEQPLPLLLCLTDCANPPRLISSVDKEKHPSTIPHAAPSRPQRPKTAIRAASCAGTRWPAIPLESPTCRKANCSSLLLEKKQFATMDGQLSGY
jgi:hypothetical protein